MTQNERNLGLRCDRCGQITTPRGGLDPRYCAVCGQKLPASAQLVRTASRRKRMPPAAPASLLLGACSLIPIFGVIPGIGAILLGSSAKRDIRNSPGEYHGEQVANGGIAFGILGVLVSLIFCGRFF